MKNIIDILRILSYFFLEMLQRRNLLLEMEKLSYHDSLTGALNRNAFIKNQGKFQKKYRKRIRCFIHRCKWFKKNK